MRILTFPFRLAAAIVLIPTRLSARLLRFSTQFTFRTTRALLGSSLITFLLGLGLGWFLASPRGQDLIGQTRDRFAPPETDLAPGPVPAANTTIGTPEETAAETASASPGT